METVDLVKLFFCYAVFGAIGVVENAVVLGCLLLKQRLRKRYILICALAGSDFLICLGFSIGGSWRIHLALNGAKNVRSKTIMIS